MIGESEPASVIRERRRLREEYDLRDRSPTLRRRFGAANAAFALHLRERERSLRRLVERHAGGLDGRRLLEVGCGSGHVLRRFLDFGVAQACGVDLMRNRIAAGRAGNPELRLAVADGTSLPFGDGAFDLVSQFMCLSSVLDAEVRAMIGAEMWRVTKPGGWILTYDFRTLPFGTRAALWAKRKSVGWLRRDVPATENSTDAEPRTPIVAIDDAEVSRLFPGEAHATTASLAEEIADVTASVPWLYTLLSRVPFLRSHHLVLVRKP